MNRYAMTYMQSGDNIGSWQAANFHPESGIFAGPDVTYHGSIRECVERFTELNRQLYTDGSAQIFAGPGDGEGWALTGDALLVKALTVGPRGGTQVETIH